MRVLAFVVFFLLAGCQRGEVEGVLLHVCLDSEGSLADVQRVFAELSEEFDLRLVDASDGVRRRDAIMVEQAGSDPVAHPEGRNIALALMGRRGAVATATNLSLGIREISVEITPAFGPERTRDLDTIIARRLEVFGSVDSAPRETGTLPGFCESEVVY